jgi:hypothetical protein
MVIAREQLGIALIEALGPVQSRVESLARREILLALEVEAAPVAVTVI